jgi:hypothetical protein
MKSTVVAREADMESVEEVASEVVREAVSEETEMIGKIESIPEEMTDNSETERIDHPTEEEGVREADSDLMLIEKCSILKAEAASVEDTEAGIEEVSEEGTEIETSSPETERTEGKEEATEEAKMITIESLSSAL